MNLENNKGVYGLMILKTGTFNGMAQDVINSQSKIVIFGTGVVGSTITPEILREYNLVDRIICCIDNDKTRWNTHIQICEKTVEILSPEVLKKLDGNITVLISISRYSSAYEQINNMKGTDKCSCYIVPSLCINSFKAKGEKETVKISEKPLIPKKIHYMWFGGKKIPQQLQKCIYSWQKFCPDYEIVRWDESNYDIHKNIFLSQAYDNQRYGFVPDFARIDILYNYGGIYLDTDVELKKNIDDLLYQEAFCSVEKWQVINFGGCSGAVKGHKSLEPFLKNWSKRQIIREDGSLENISSGLIDTSIAIKSGYKINGRTQSIMGMNIYTYDYFHPYDYMTGRLDMTDNTYSVHHFNGGWLDDKTKADNIKAKKSYEALMKTAVNVG